MLVSISNISWISGMHSLFFSVFPPHSRSVHEGDFSQIIAINFRLFLGVNLNLNLLVLSRLSFYFDGSGKVFRKKRLMECLTLLLRGRCDTVDWPAGHVLDPELPGVGQHVHVGGEPLVVSVAGDPVSQQVNVPVPQPGDRPVAEVGDGAHHPDVLPKDGPHLTLLPHTMTWTPTSSYRKPKLERFSVSYSKLSLRNNVAGGFLCV